MMRRAWIRRGARLVTHHPLRALLLALALAGAGAALAAELKLKSSYTALLPQGSPMVRELEQARRHAGGTAELVNKIYALSALCSTKRILVILWDASR